MPSIDLVVSRFRTSSLNIKCNHFLQFIPVGSWSDPSRNTYFISWSGSQVFIDPSIYVYWDHSQNAWKSSHIFVTVRIIPASREGRKTRFSNPVSVLSILWWWYDTALSFVILLLLILLRTLLNYSSSKLLRRIILIVAEAGRLYSNVIMGSVTLCHNSARSLHLSPVAERISNQPMKNDFRR